MLDYGAGRITADPNWQRRLIFWAALTALAFLSFWYAFDIMLLGFAGALFAIVLHAFSEWIERYTPTAIGPKISSTAAVVGLIMLTALIAYWIVPRASSEAGQIVQVIPTSLEQLTTYLDTTSWGRYLQRIVNRVNGPAHVESELSRLANDVGALVEGSIVVIVIGFYGALNARDYNRGLLELVPKQKRQRFAEVSQGVAYALRWWLIGQLLSMSVLGCSTMIGLWALGVPLAFTLGLFTGIMIFIPYVGSWIAFIPTVLVALTRGPATAVYVAILFLAVHLTEGYVLTPLVQKRVVLLPPVVTILAQLLLWKVSGLRGIALATPIAATALVLVRMLYLHEDVRRNQPS